MSDSNLASLAIVDEATFGTDVTSGWGMLRYTGESLVYNINNTQSAEIRADRNVQDLIRTDASASGDINFELSYGTYDDLLAAALCGSWVEAGTAGDEGDTLVNGTTKRSFQIEKKFAGITTPRYHKFRGMTVGGMSLDVSAGDIVTGSFTFLGKNMSDGTSPAQSGSYTAATTSKSMNAVENVGSIKEGGSVVSDTIMSLSLSIENNLRARNGIGTLGATSVGLGQFNVTGNMSVYFNSGAVFNKFLNGTDSSVEFTLGDGTNTYTFLLPKVEYTNGRVVAGSTNSDIMAEMEFTAKFDTATGGSIKVTR